MGIGRRSLRTRQHQWVSHLGRFLSRRGVLPNHVSIAGIFCALGAMIFFIGSSGAASGWLLLGAAVLIQLRLLCNMMDGYLAIEGGLQSKSGDLFNEVPDRYEDVMILAGAGYAAGSLVLGMAAALLAVLTAYTRVFGVSIGAPAFFQGPMAKQHRMFVVTAAALLQMFFSGWPVLLAGLWIIAVGASVTLYRRTRLIVRQVGE